MIDPRRLYSYPTSLFAIAVFLWLLINWCVALFGQEASIVQLNQSGGFGYGVVIAKTPDPAAAGGYIGLIATAAHVVPDSTPTIGCKFSNGRTSSKATATARDRTADVAIVRAWVPNEIPPLAMGDDPREGNELVLLTQRGRVRTNASRVYSAWLFADTDIYSGDSGGAVVDSENRLVGIISGGWFVMTDRNKTFIGQLGNETTLSPHWPARAGKVSRVRELLR